MGAMLKRIDDPRDALERARRSELVKFAKANGVGEINPEMPAILMRKILRGKNMTRIPIVPQVLGAPAGGSITEPDASAPANEVNADDDMARQFAQYQKPAKKTLAQMSINEIGAEMKRLKIKRDRRDNMTTMRAKIEAHGKNSA